MAITITQERKKQRYLMLALALVICGIIFMVWWGFFRGEEEVAMPLNQPIIYAPPQVAINWQLLKDIRGQFIRPFEEISEFKGEFGRTNPFMPY